MEIVVEESPAAADLQQLNDGLTSHASPFVDSPGFRPAAVWLRDKTDLRGGAYGKLNWTWLYVAQLWVHPDLRGQGWGRALMLALEQYAITRGCRHAHLDTFSFQARDFYESLGYTVFAQLPEYPPGHQRLFLKKQLG